MTTYEAAVIMAYTGYATLVGDKLNVFHKYCEDLMGRPILTHEYPYLSERIKLLSKPDFIKICRSIED